MKEHEYTVGIVVDRDFGERLRALSGLKAVWVIESPVNTPVCAAIWQEEGFVGGLTHFNSDGMESAEEACLRIADTVDEHHGASAQGGPWMEIQVIGTPLGPELEELFRDLGATAFAPSPSGFTCTRVLPATPGELLTALTEALAAREVFVPTAPATRTMEEAVQALFSLAAQIGALDFLICSEETEARALVTSITFSWPDPQRPPPTSGLLGWAKRDVLQYFAPALFEPLTRALATLSRKGSEPGRPTRGELSLPRDAADPDLRFLVEFQDTPPYRYVMAIARTREARALFPPLSALPLSAPERAYLAERLWRLDTLFQGQPIVFTGPVDAGRETSFLSALTALPATLSNGHATKALILSERARPYDPRWTVLLLGPELPLGQALRSRLRETAHLLFAETVRTDEELKLLLESASAGKGVLYGLEDPPEAALARMGAVVPGLVHSPLFVHHTRDVVSGVRSAALYVRDPDSPLGAPRVIRWCHSP